MSAPESEGRARVEAWFNELQGRLCQALESLEDAILGPGADLAPGRFERKPWRREGAGHGGGVMAILRGRLFEKAGVNVSAVSGVFSEQFKGEIPGTAEDPRFWASGISVVVHPRSPLVPAAHMNT
ncbi:MAG: coproporphyrinogen III oxidase, partial [Alphaproteobacteria bacterium]